ncbi:MAG: 2-C-methyl-D-erythritol 2,4-cyclodiphosphate synthase [Actinomycetota bacterium]
MRIGIGFDVHAFDDSRPLVLGGVTIEGAPGLAGWSDADVVSHAIADALLGAAGLGDLGNHFPEEKVAEGSSSLEMLFEVTRLLAESGFEIGNIDSTVVVQQIRIGPFCEQMTNRIAEVLAIPAGLVNMKATTTDGLGFIGRAEGIAAMAIATLQ